MAGAGSSFAQQQSDVPPGLQAPPVNLQPDGSDADIWRQIRRGDEGQVTIPNQQAGRLIQSEGDNWRTVRNGPYTLYGGWIILGMIGLLALFFALRGRIRLHGGWAGVRIQRFNTIDRFTHWFTATCFIVLALSGLNLMFGRSLLLPLLGKETFAFVTQYGKYLHNYLAFGFMLGILLMFVLWVAHNIPNRYDVIWLVRGGGMFGGGHPPARKFNAGQKILFWLVILLGLSLSLSGLQLLFPYQFNFFEGTFVFLNRWFDLGLPADLSPVAEQQLATLWHGIVGLVLTAIILGHIYIGTVGMEGAFDAMGSGRVDYNWAKEHHSVWVRETERKMAVPGE
jgi:formate dehydrogenase subunit gamma